MAYLTMGDVTMHPFGKPGAHLAELARALPSCRKEDLAAQLPVEFHAADSCLIWTERSTS
jgi:hypothetical protein